MAQTSVAQFASELKVQPSVLLEQLKAAGVDKAGPKDSLSEQDKSSLLEYLRRSHGSQEPKNKITLTRKQTSEIKKSDSMGKARTIQVEVRKKRVFVNRDPNEMAEAEAPAATAALVPVPEQAKEAVAKEAAAKEAAAPTPAPAPTVTEAPPAPPPEAPKAAAKPVAAPEAPPAARSACSACGTSGACSTSGARLRHRSQAARASQGGGETAQAALGHSGSGTQGQAGTGAQRLGAEGGGARSAGCARKARLEAASKPSSATPATEGTLHKPKLSAADAAKADKKPKKTKTTTVLKDDSARRRMIKTRGDAGGGVAEMARTRRLVAAGAGTGVLRSSMGFH